MLKKSSKFLFSIICHVALIIGAIYIALYVNNVLIKLPDANDLIEHINQYTPFCKSDYVCIEIFDIDGLKFKALFKHKYSNDVYIKHLEFCKNCEDLHIYEQNK